MNIIGNNKMVENAVQENYYRALNDSKLQSLINNLNVSQEEIKNNVTKLEETLKQLDNCKNCKGLASCLNPSKGCVSYPKNYNNHLEFFYLACRYKKQKIKQDKEKMTQEKVLANASLKDLDTTDKNRYPLIKWVTKFIKEYDNTKSNKGLYLHGNFGCGKTYILACLFNEMKVRGYSTSIVYFPSLLKDLKGDFDSMLDTLNFLDDVDLLLIDDIGAEKVTEWGRDEILGTILQYRMNNMKTTFFTSNFNIPELEKHLSNNGSEPIKANRIIERIKYLTVDMEMVSKNMRK